MVTTGIIQRTEEERRKRPINRVETMYPIRNLFDKMYREAREAKEAGKLVGWCMGERFCYPFLNTMDIETVYPENYATACASAGAITPFLERSEAEGFPNYVCSYMQNTFGYTARMLHELGGQIPPEAPRGGMPKPDFLLASGRGCEARYKAFQALGRYLDVPVWCTEQPRPGERESLMEGVYDRSVEFCVKRMREFVPFLERLTGKKFDWDIFEENVNAIIEMETLFWNVSDLRKARPCPMHARDYFSSMIGAFRIRDVEEVLKLYRNMYDEVKYRVDNKISGINQPEKYRLAFNGLGPWHSMRIFDWLAERGWNFAREGYHYEPPIPVDPSITDPVERIIRFRWQDPSGVIDYYFEPDEAADVKEEIKRRGYSPRLTGAEVMRYQCDGTLLWSSLTCHAGGATQYLYPIQLMEAYKVPTLVVETDMCDPRLFDFDDFKRRAETFEETMDHYKEVRKKEGLPW